MFDSSVVTWSGHVGADKAKMIARVCGNWWWVHREWQPLGSKGWSWRHMVAAQGVTKKSAQPLDKGSMASHRLLAVAEGNGKGGSKL